MRISLQIPVSPSLTAVSRPRKIIVLERINKLYSYYIVRNGAVLTWIYHGRRYIRRTLTRRHTHHPAYSTFRLVENRRESERVRQVTRPNRGRTFDLDEALWPDCCHCLALTCGCWRSSCRTPAGKPGWGSVRSRWTDPDGASAGSSKRRRTPGQRLGRATSWRPSASLPGV